MMSTKDVRPIFIDAFEADLTGLSNLELSALAKGVAERIHGDAIEIAAREVEAAHTDDEAARLLGITLGEVEQALARTIAQEEALRRERGIASVDGGKTSALDKQLDDIRRQQELAEDRRRALLDRLATAKERARATNRAALQARFDALCRLQGEAAARAEVAERRFHFATAVVNILRAKTDGYAAALPRA